MRLPEGSIIEGDRLLLRELTIDDAGGAYARWLDDPEVNRFLESRFRKHTVESIRDYVRKQQNDPSTLFLAIVLRNGMRHIGNIKIGNIHPHHASADVGVIIGEKDCWNRGYATEAIRLVVGYSARTLHLVKLVAGFYAANVGSIAAFERAGFVREGVQKDLFAVDGRRMDGVLMGWTIKA